jgi:hypothetical protein
LTTVGLSTCVSVALSRLPGKTLLLLPTPGMMLLRLTLSSRSKRPRTLKRVRWLSTVSTRSTTFLRTCSGRIWSALFEVQAWPVPVLGTKFGIGSRLSVAWPIGWKYFGLMMFVPAVVPTQGTPLRPPVPAAQKKSVTPRPA